MPTMLKQIIVVYGYGASDIGKGWLAASIAKSASKPQIIKIDPFLNQTFPSDLGVSVNGKIVSDDFRTYQSVGLDICSSHNLLNGQVLASMLQDNRKYLQRGDEKKLTFVDTSEAMAARLCGLIRPDVELLVIEVGGTITDREHAWIPDALRILAQMTGIMPEIILLTYLEASETGYRVKTHNVRNAIRAARSHVGLPIFACFVRRRYVPESVTCDDISREFFNISFETQFPVNRIILEENFAQLQGLCGFVSGLNLFNSIRKRVFVSACLLGCRCRYNGKGKMLDPRTIAELHSAEVFSACPEVLGGLGIPRVPCEIPEGDGHAVLDRIAVVKSKEGIDRSIEYIRGAERALAIIRQASISEIILCDYSPSCGYTHIYDGNFTRTEREGMGVFASLLVRNGYGSIVRSVRPGHST